MGDVEQAPVLVVTPARDLGARLVRDLGTRVGAECVRSIPEAQSAVVERWWRGMVVDLQLPDGSGLELLEQARLAQPDVEALALAGMLEVSAANRAAMAGAFFAAKPYQRGMLREFVRRCERKPGAMRTGTDPSASRVLEAEEVSRLARRQVVSHEVERAELTPREEQILLLLVEGRPWHEVVQDLGISARTYGTHVSRILRKTRAGNIGALVIRLLLEAQEIGVHAAREV